MDRLYLGQTLFDLKRHGLPPAWRGKVAVIVGGGPSLAGFDFDLLKNRHVVAVNRTFEDLPQAEVVYFSDLRFWRWHGRELLAHRGLKVTCWPTDKLDWRGLGVRPENAAVVGLRRRPAASCGGLASDPHEVCLGNSSGYAAVNVAAHLGAPKIVLLGYDFRLGDDGRQHHHADHPIELKDRHLEKMARNFPAIAAPLRARGIEVVNACPTSRLDCFPKMGIKDALLITTRKRQMAARKIATNQIWQSKKGTTFALVTKATTKQVTYRARNGKGGPFSDDDSTATVAAFRAGFKHVKG